ncbi:THAP domain-containing protein 3-like isoform X1 [Dermacentor albipictus]|uniref:THAP domain-containing protein 3-like isoform X1 n=1 Tax=Dermacentor albipictus TaxID=60249 RepID=UPI0031FCD163
MGGSWCCVEGCTNRSTKTNGVCYHRFPSDNALRKKWLCAVRRVVWSPDKNACVCSDHFTPDCYKDSVYLMEAFGLAKANYGRRLKEDAVPTLFVYTKPSHPPLPRWRAAKLRRAQLAQEALSDTKQIDGSVECSQCGPSSQATTSLRGSQQTASCASTTAERNCDFAVKTHYVGHRTRAAQTCLKNPSVGIQASPVFVKDSSIQTNAAVLRGTTSGAKALVSCTKTRC